MTKKELALAVIERLKEAYPMAECTLDYDQAWKLLVSVRLAAQCTDARVNVVVQDLYAKFPDVESLAAADPAEIEEIVKPCGLGHSKARDISACMRVLRDQYGGKVPEDFDALLALPGVGRKSANLIMGDVFGKPAIVTDTHCIRLTNRMGLVDGGKRFLPPSGDAWTRCLYSPNEAVLWEMCAEGYLPEDRRAGAGYRGRGKGKAVMHKCDRQEQTGRQDTWSHWQVVKVL